MRLPRRRLRPLRRLGRPGRPPADAERPLPLHESPTELDVPSVLEEIPPAPPPRSRLQESTVEMSAVPEEIAVPPTPRAQPAAPPKVEFACPCGARLLATPQTYDKHSRCAACRTVLLLSLVYDGERESYEVVPFRVNPGTGP